jgi:hypothetical protein
MRKRIFLIFNLVCLSGFSQNGLENIIVEKYYVSDANDTTANYFAGKLPIGSTTYRIYADLLPGYRFQAAFGSSEHELRIETSTSFFNNTEHGSTIPNVIPQRTLKKNTVMLDSWLSVGAAGEDCFGILKTDDDSIETIYHEKKFLKNIDSNIGVSLTIKDGLVKGENIPRPTFFAIDKDVEIFGNMKSGSSFVLTNGAWACLGGSVGLDSLKTNRVLIAQMTTDGDFSFELNIQIGNPLKGVTQKYVARNPVENEISIPSLIYFDKRNISYKVKGEKVNKKRKFRVKNN